MKNNLCKCLVISIFLTCIFRVTVMASPIIVDNFSIEIVDESEITLQALEKFYQDENYSYYFNSVKSDFVYAIINGNEKYLVKDLLNNNPTKYNVTIEKLEQAGLKCYKSPSSL